MRKLAGLLTVIFAAALLTGCATYPSKETKEPTVQHTVVFWLKEKGNTADRDTLIGITKELAKIPGVLDMKAGTVIPGDRPVVDSTYDVAVTFTFKNKKALDDYDVHPTHKKAVESIRAMVSKITVYDFEIR